jgi:hypothetical protein
VATAHQRIADAFETLSDGDVIDVPAILRVMNDPEFTDQRS